MTKSHAPEFGAPEEIANFKKAAEMVNSPDWAKNSMLMADLAGDVSPQPNSASTTLDQPAVAETDANAPENDRLVRGVSSDPTPT